MRDPSHRGARVPGPTAPGVDRRLLDLDEALRSVEVTSAVSPQLQFARDSTRALQAQQGALGLSGRFVRGTIIHAIPYANWYKVQVGSAAGWIGACLLSHTSLVPLGPRETGTLAPLTSVLVYMPRGVDVGFIVAVVPPVITDGALVTPDWIVQGGGSGLKRESAHLYPIRQTGDGGGVVDWSANRPLDETAFQIGWITTTGLLFSLDDAMLQLRVNEMCGLWFTLCDSYTRLAGINMLVESSIHEETHKDDEGEARSFHGEAAYPWEALGLYTPHTPFTQEYDDKEVQYDLPYAKIDLPKGAEDVQPLYRYVAYGGYLGQGHFRAVVAPARRGGVRRYQDTDHDEGLFCEQIGLDGSYSLRSAKSLHIGKRCKIIVPRERQLPEDGRGDDARSGTYKHSGLFGSGPEHKVGDVVINGELPNWRRAAAVNDLISHLVNWKGLHPFHYHQQDFSTPQEAKQTGTFARVQDKLDFSELRNSPYLASPSPQKLRIDHRYNDVAYYMRESFLTFHEDGTVQLGCGYGSQIVFSGGGISIEPAAFLRVQAGTDVIMRADQICLTARGAVDLSSANSDVRLKAERNLQVLAGNDGTGGILLESRGTGLAQRYAGKIGEEVEAAGIILKVANGVAAVLAQDIYLRSGGADLGAGDIVLDAGRGRQRVQVYGDEIIAFANRTVTLAIGPTEESSTVKRVHQFGAERCVLDSPTYVGGRLTGYRGASIVVDGDIRATGSVSCAGVMGDNKGGALAKVPNGFNNALLGITEAAAATVDTSTDTVTNQHENLVKKYYGAERPGSTDTVAAIGFSFRDPPTRDQYYAKNLLWPEPRWQTLKRFGLAAGGSAWTEPAVRYQGEATYPYPGRQKYIDEPAFLQLAELTMFDAATGQSKDRPYEQPTLADWRRVTMATGYTLNR